jgi:hypothetical protein
LNHYFSDIFGHWCGHNIHPRDPTKISQPFGTISRSGVQIKRSSAWSKDSCNCTAILGKSGVMVKTATHRNMFSMTISMSDNGSVEKSWATHNDVTQFHILAK